MSNLLTAITRQCKDMNLSSSDESKYFTNERSKNALKTKLYFN